jgi:hypothetical protein
MWEGEGEDHTASTPHTRVWVCRYDAEDAVAILTAKVKSCCLVVVVVVTWGFGFSDVGGEVKGCAVATTSCR